MKTITMLTEIATTMERHQLPATVQVGSIELSGRGYIHNAWGRAGRLEGMSISFTLRCRPDHLHNIIKLGVTIDFASAVSADVSPASHLFRSGRAAIKAGRYLPYHHMGDPSQRVKAYAENWLDFRATCDIATLQCLNTYCRDNERAKVSICNDHDLAAAGGWTFARRYEKPRPMLISSAIAKKLRAKGNAKKWQGLLPIEQRAADQKRYE